MKTYKKLQYSGNINEWTEPTKDLGNVTMHDAAAAEMQKQFEATGIKYVEDEEAPAEVDEPADENHEATAEVK